MRARVLLGRLPLPLFGFVALCAIWVVLIAWTNLAVAALQARSTLPNLPYGIFVTPDHALSTQDLAYNTLFLRGVSAHLVDHPYRIEEQEKMMRHLLPESTGGMTHAYSPVAFVVAQPFLLLSGRELYVLYTVVSAGGVLCLYYFYLMPRITSPLQVCAFLVCASSLCVVAQLRTGQSALITTTLIAAIWSWVRHRSKSGGLGRDFAIAVIFWLLCAKPSVALVPGVLLLAERAWRPLAFTVAMLALTWLVTANYYGGAWTGLQDYAYLLNHYNNAEFSPYMKRSLDPADQTHFVVWLFQLDRAAILCAGAALIFLRWTGRITRPQVFQGMIWVFVLLSPYLMGSEYWILCLLIVESSFMPSANRLALMGKLLLLAGILNLREGVTTPFPGDVYLKWLLFGWIAAEAAWSCWAQPNAAVLEIPESGERAPELSQPGRWA